MICPDCEGKGERFLRPIFRHGVVFCSTCEGTGELPDEKPAAHCRACGEPLFGDDEWCDAHKLAAEVLKNIEL
jgi:hypothetical protein